MSGGSDRRTFLKRMGAGAMVWAIPSGRAPWPPQAVDEADYWQQVRAQYPLTTQRTYLNTGGLGPAPYPVLDAVQRTTMHQQLRSETGHNLIMEARTPVARFFGADPAELAFTRNATEGNATIASGLNLKRGEEVIFESHAHPGGSIPWMTRQKRDGILAKIFDPDPTSTAGNLERIAARITPQTRVIQVSHVTAPTGIRMPVKAIAELAQERGLWFHVDGAQSAGMFPVDLHAMGCDSFATSGHKWMGAPHGTGILYVRKDRLDEVWPTDVGAYADANFTLPTLLDFNPSAQRFECGTRDAAQIVGFEAAVHFLETIGMERVAAYGQGLAHSLQDQLRAIPGVSVLTPTLPELSGSITTFKTRNVPYDELNLKLGKDYRLRTRVVTEQGLNAVRISTHIFNNEAEVTRVAEAVKQIVNGQ